MRGWLFALLEIFVTLLLFAGILQQVRFPMKRQGDNGQLSREEYDALDEDEAEAGVYKKASADKMAGRKIVKRGQ